VRGRLEPEIGAVVMQALAAAGETLYQRHGDVSAETSTENVPAETPTIGQQQADALELIAETALQHGMYPGASDERYQVVVHVRRRGPRGRRCARPVRA
jgi:hypothetical protein